MGTSSSNPGTKGSTPLVPTWLADPIQEPPSSDVTQRTEDEDQIQSPNEEDQPQPTPIPQKYTAARGNFTRFVKSSGRDTDSLRRAVSSYVRKSSGGVKNATTKMGSSRKTASQLLGFLNEASSQNIDSALKSLNLNNLAGKPLDEIFLGLSDLICPEGGSVDAGIARDAFIKTIADVVENDIADIDNLNTEQVQTIFEIYITHTIEDKLLNEIGLNIYFQTQTLEDSELIQDQLNDFIKNSVSDALASSQDKIESISQDEVGKFVDKIYEQTFTILSALYEDKQT